MADESHRASVPGRPAPRDHGDASVDPEIARAEIEAIRARMSGTIDEIEEALLRRKERVARRLDLFRTIRERPLASLAAAFAAGLILGLLTGGDEGQEPAPVAARSGSRAERWEHRSRRLLRIAQEQERELERLRAAGGPREGAAPFATATHDATWRSRPEGRRFRGRRGTP